MAKASRDRRQEHIDFTATTSLRLQQADEDDETGLTVYMLESSHYDLYLKQLPDGKQAVGLRCRLGSLTHIGKEVILPRKEVQLRVTGDKDYYHFAYSSNGKDFKELGKADVRYLSSETCGGFTGIMLGLYATAKDKGSKAYAEATYFDYEGK